MTNGRWFKLAGIKCLVAFLRPYSDVGKDANMGVHMEGMSTGDKRFQMSTQGSIL